MNVEIGIGPHSSFSGNICFEFSVQCLCSEALNISILLPEPALLALFAARVAPEYVVDLLLLVIHQLVRVPTLL